MTPPQRGEENASRSDEERGFVSLFKKAVGWLRNTWQRLWSK